MLQDEVPILIFLPLDGLATSVTIVCEVAALAKEAWNDPVKGRTLETKPFVSRAQGRKLLLPLELCPQTSQRKHHNDEEHSGVDHGQQHMAAGDRAVCFLIPRCFIIFVTVAL